MIRARFSQWEDGFGFIVSFGTLEKVDFQNGVIKQPERNLIDPRGVGARSNLPAIWVLTAISGLPWNAVRCSSSISGLYAGEGNGRPKSIPPVTGENSMENNVHTKFI